MKVVVKSLKIYLKLRRSLYVFVFAFSALLGTLLVQQLVAENRERNEKGDHLIIAGKNYLIGHLHFNESFEKFFFKKLAIGLMGNFTHFYQNIFKKKTSL